MVRGTKVLWIHGSGGCHYVSGGGRGELQPRPLHHLITDHTQSSDDCPKMDLENIGGSGTDPVDWA
eukprot:907857-Lingulodinium_polyedra.AAC.1